ncbi:MAG: LysE family translocator [Pseudomonadota bacterium]
MNLDQLSFLMPPLLAFFVAAASPGPATLAVAATSMARGLWASLALGVGLTIGLSVWGILTAVGLGALIIAWAPALLLLKSLGGAYLLYLAWLSAKSALSADDPGALKSAPEDGVGRRMIWRGFILNIMNPKAVLAWTAVIALGTPDQGGAFAMIVIVGLCTFCGLLIYWVYAASFSAPIASAVYMRGRRWIEGVFALGFGLAGLKLILSRN